MGTQEITQEMLNGIHPEMTAVEQEVIFTMLHDILEAGYTVSVYDGEAWAVKRGSDLKEIFSALYSTGSDQLRLRRVIDGEKFGSIWLVYQGNEYESPVSDYTANEVIEGLLKNANAVAERYDTRSL